MDYWTGQVSKLKQKTTKELEQLIITLEESLIKYNGGFYEMRNYLEHVKCEYAERIGK